MVELPGLQAAIQRKYAIMQQEADARSALERAQAGAIPSSTASENALRAAQAYQTTQQGNQVAPLAQSQIGEAQARSGYYGAEGRLADTTGRITSLGLFPLSGALSDAVGRNFQRDNQTPATVTVTPDHAASIYNAHPIIRGLGGNTGASTSDPLSSSAFTNTGKFGFSGGDQSESVEPGSQGFKKGSANIHGKAPQAGKSKGLAGLMASLGAGGQGPQAPVPSSPMASPMAGGSPAPMPMGGPPIGMMAGTPQVPGKGSGNVDKVPAMLAPHEAVLTHGAADALGRNKIAKLNAQHPPKPVGKVARPPLRRGMP